MYVINARNVSEALYEGLDLLRFGGHRRDSRNGPVWRMDGPVTTMYREPRERVLVWPARDANPFFHLFESLWMLAGRDDLAPLTWYVQRMRDFSDDGETLRGAYGQRWLHFFGHDQLAIIIETLRSNPDDRRCVLGMWGAADDLGVDSRDVPCNLVAKFSRGRRGELNMTVFCRSNDIVWGAYGANAVHFSILQEYMAAGIGCEVGRYWQVSDDWHGYEKTVTPLLHSERETDQYQYRGTSAPLWRPLVQDFAAWNADLVEFMGAACNEGSDPRALTFREPFFNEVAAPMHAAYGMHRERLYGLADCLMDEVTAPDWQRAGREWLARRHAKWRERRS